MRTWKAIPDVSAASVPTSSACVCFCPSVSIYLSEPGLCARLFVCESIGQLCVFVVCVCVTLLECLMFAFLCLLINVCVCEVVCVQQE